MNPLEQINAVAGLCIKMPGWPDSLRKIGYLIDRIELKFNIVDSKGISRTINPDIVLVSDQKNSSLFFELKSGGLQKECEEQFERYSEVKQEDVIQKAAITSKAPRHHKNSVVLFCNAEHKEHFEKLIDSKKMPIAIVSYDEKEIKLILNSIGEPLTNEIFREGIKIEGMYPPLSLIPILPDSDEIHLIETIVDCIIGLLVKKTRNFTLDQLLENVFNSGLWQAFDTEAKKNLRNRTREILREMCNTEFKEYIVRRGGSGKNPEEWTLKNHPNNKKTTQFQGIRNLKLEYISRKSRDELYKDYNPHQDSLFAALEEDF